jgi:hypothetical protein
MFADFPVCITLREQPNRLNAFGGDAGSSEKRGVQSPVESLPCSVGKLIEYLRLRQLTRFQGCLAVFSQRSILQCAENLVADQHIGISREFASARRMRCGRLAQSNTSDLKQVVVRIQADAGYVTNPVFDDQSHKSHVVLDQRTALFI